MADDAFSNTVDPVWLREQLVSHFSLDELRDLCFELDIDFENLPGEAKAGKAREMIIYCRNRAMMNQLTGKVQLARPNLPWTTGGISQGTKPADEAAPEQLVYALVQAFNKNRHRAISPSRTQVGDDIAFQMRELAPELDGKIDVTAWLRSDNIGKRIAAVEFLDWKKDVEFLNPLLDRLFIEQPFVQFHILIVLNSMLDQLSYDQMKLLQKRLAEYRPDGDHSRKIWVVSIQDRIDDWFRVVG